MEVDRFLVLPGFRDIGNYFCWTVLDTGWFVAVFPVPINFKTKIELLISLNKSRTAEFSRCSIYNGYRKIAGVVTSKFTSFLEGSSYAINIRT